MNHKVKVKWPPSDGQVHVLYNKPKNHLLQSVIEKLTLTVNSYHWHWKQGKGQIKPV